MKLSIIVLIVVLSVSLGIGSALGFMSMKSAPNIITANQTKLYIKTMPVSLQPINQTYGTSIVAFTNLEGNHTILHLMNGLNVTDITNQIQSGDILSLNMTILKPKCVVSIGSSDNIQNNTQVTVQFFKSPSCDVGTTALYLNHWEKLNHK